MKKKFLFLRGLLRRIFFIFSPVFFLVIVMISKFFHIRFCMLPSERIGELVTRLEIYLCEKKLNINRKKTIDIFFFNDVLSNLTYCNLVKPKINLVSNLIAFPIYKFIILISKKIHYFNKFVFTVKYEDDHFSMMQTDNNIKFNRDQLIKGEEFLKSIGINDKDKIVCLLVRDSTYLKKKFPGVNQDRTNYRNCNFENFIPAIDKLTELGYYVFRMGEVVEKEYKLNNSKFIDYTTNFRTDFLDIYLAYRCTFAISTSSGWDNVPAFVFRKPVVLTNNAPTGFMLSYSDDLIYSMKIHKDKKTNKFLSLNEINDLGLSHAYNTKEFVDANIELLDNSSSEIVNMVNEMLELIEDKERFKKKNFFNINLFWKKYNNVCKLTNDPKYKERFKHQIKFDPHLKLRCPSKRLFKGKNVSFFSPSFLEKNMFLIK